MTLAVRDTDCANLQGIYQLLDMPPLNMAEEQFVVLYFRGMSIPASERGAGMSAGKGRKLLLKDGVLRLIEYLQSQILTDLSLSMQQLNIMLLEAHRKSQTSTEEINAVNSLARLNMLGGFAPAAVIQKRLEDLDKDNAKDITPSSSKQLERMDESKLLEMADFENLDSLNPEPVKARIDNDEEDDDGEDDSSGEVFEEDEEDHRSVLDSISGADVDDDTDDCSDLHRSL